MRGSPGSIMELTEYTERQPPLSGAHSIMMEKLEQALEGGGCTPTPFTNVYLTSRAVLWWTLQLRGQIHFPYFYSTPICAL